MKRNFLLNEKGITLIETMVVIVIIGILLIIWKFASNGHIKIAIVNEGRTFIEKIVAQERMYRANKGSFKPIPTDINHDDDIMINTYDNKYFLVFTVTDVTTTGFKVTITGSNDTKASGMSIIGTYVASDNSLEITENGI